MENLNFVLGQSLVHNKKPRSSQMCAFNFKSVVKTKYENLLSLTYKTVIQLPEVEVDMQKPVSKRCCKECRSFYISEPGHEKMGSYCMKHSLPICTVWKCLSSLLHK